MINPKCMMLKKSACVVHVLQITSSFMPCHSEHMCSAHKRRSEDTIKVQEVNFAPEASAQRVDPFNDDNPGCWLLLCAIPNSFTLLEVVDWHLQPANKNCYVMFALTHS